MEPYWRPCHLPARPLLVPEPDIRGGMPRDETFKHQQALEIRWLIGGVAAWLDTVFPTPTGVRCVAGQQDGTLGRPQ